MRNRHVLVGASVLALSTHLVGAGAPQQQPIRDPAAQMNGGFTNPAVASVTDGVWMKGDLVSSWDPWWVRARWG